jgi:hypothetical protein
MNSSQQFPFIESQDAFGVVDFLPKLPIALSYRQRSVSGIGLLDTGASVNVLPYGMGRDLGLVFFAEFDVCFYQSQLKFEVRRK